MKKGICLALTLFLIWTGFEPVKTLFSVERIAQALPRNMAPGTAEIPGNEAVHDNEEIRDAVLYYRFGDTAYLGTAKTEIDLRREETIATTIVERLIEGPKIGYDRLNGLFPRGTRLISAVSDGTTVFVTLNHAFLDSPDGAPQDWEDSEGWQREAALRRTMALQSIVLSLTENADVQRVQLYIAEMDDEIGQRLQMAWFDPDISDPQVYLGACGRDERICLSAHNAMKAILTAWQQNDWKTLALFLNRGANSIHEEEALSEKMEALGVELLSFTVSEGVVSLDGSKATIVLDGTIRSAAGEVLSLNRESCLLIREADNWTIEPATLDRLMVRD